MPAVTPVPARKNLQITIVAGTPVRLASPDTPSPVMVDRLFIQSRNANNAGGLIYVMDGVPLATTLNAADTTQLTAELGVGQNYGDPPGGAGGWNQTPPVDLRFMGIDGTVNGDKVIVSYYLRT